MAAKTIPSLGEAFLGDDPAVMKVLKITFGDSDQDVSIQIADSTTIVRSRLCSLPVGIHVYDVGWIVRTAFNGSTDIILGLDGDCDAFAEDTDISCTTADLQMNTMKQRLMVRTGDSWPLNAVPARAGGYTPDSANNLAAFATKADTTADSGVMEVYIYYHGAVNT